MTTTLPPDPLLDALKSGEDQAEIAAVFPDAMGKPARHRIPMAEAAPWRGGPCHVVAGVRWYSPTILHAWIGSSGRIPAQLIFPIYALDVDEAGIALRPRRRWMRTLFRVLLFWLLLAPMPVVGAPWSEISGVRRTKTSLAFPSVTEFCINGEWVGVTRVRTRTLDDTWSAAVHFFRASRPVASAGAATVTEGVA